LVADIELIRRNLGIENWVVFGGSWGATLALIYAQAHPETVRALVLRGVFLMTQPELDWFYGGGAGRFWPELWARFADLIPVEEQGNFVAAYHKRLFSGDHAQEVKYARAWAHWENALAAMGSDGTSGEAPAEYARAFARLENHYFVNGGFLNKSQQILHPEQMAKIARIPGIIVQGRYDMICPPESAHKLSKSWANSRLVMVARAGHALSEPGISAALVHSMDQYGADQNFTGAKGLHGASGR
jgi:proline iminopeptidase